MFITRVPLRGTLGGAGLALVLLAACGDSSGPNGGASLSGTVSAAGTPLADATVSIGALKATSNASGLFELTGVPTGTATVRVVRPGYQPAQASVSIIAGENHKDFSLTPQELYSLIAGALLVPAGTEPIRGVIIALGGPEVSGFVTGERILPSDGPPELEAGLQSLGARLRSLARSRRVALFGANATQMQNSATNDNVLFAALTSAAPLSGRPELADAPVLMLALSGGSRLASGLVDRNPDRAIGLLARVPASVSVLTTASALAVPTFVMQAQDDGIVDNTAVRADFLTNRKNDGLWALAVEPGVGHADASDAGNAATIEWLNSALSARLPATAGDPLVALDEASGWLGNHSTLEIAPWADYTDLRSAASWLLSESAAGSWKSLGTEAGGGN